MPRGSDESGNLCSATSYRIRSLNSKSVGSSGRPFLLFLFSLLIKAKPLVKIVMTRERKIRCFLSNHFSASGSSVLTTSLSSALFPFLVSVSFQLSHSSLSIFPSLLIASLIAHMKCEGREGRELLA